LFYKVARSSNITLFWAVEHGGVW